MKIEFRKYSLKQALDMDYYVSDVIKTPNNRIILIMANPNRKLTKMKIIVTRRSFIKKLPTIAGYYGVITNSF